jgi:hypothetical protein
MQASNAAAAARRLSFISFSVRRKSRRLGGKAMSPFRIVDDMLQTDPDTDGVKAREGSGEPP